MRLMKAASAALLALTAAQSALAADLPSRRRAPQNDYYSAMPPVFTWTGFYAGLNAGIGWGNFTHGSDQLFGRPIGVEAGVTVGFNYQFNRNFVAGVEGDWNLTNINNRQNLPFFGFSGKGNVDTIGSLRVRGGYAADKALIYLTGGLAGGTMSSNVSSWQNAFAFSGSGSSFNLGWALGAGVEYAFTDKVSAKAEYLFSQLGPKDQFRFNFTNSAVGANVSQVRMGVNYHF